jgi:thioredoxin 1
MGLHKFNDDNFEQDVLQSIQPVLVDFTAEWCGPCKAVTPIIEQLAETYGEQVKIGKLDVDESQKTAMRFGVMGIPTLIFFKGGEAVDQLVGAVPKQDIEEKLNKVLG